MKIKFVDAENVGLKVIDDIHLSAGDKVYVFSNTDAKRMKHACKEHHFIRLSGYPTGANQADFYIVAYLSRMLSTLPKNEVKICVFELYTKDKNLISAFKFQCNLDSAKYRICNDIEKVIEHNTTSNTKRIFDALKTERPLNPKLQDKLGLSQSEFTRAIYALIKNKKIQRSLKRKKFWVQCH